MDKIKINKQTLTTKLIPADLSFNSSLTEMAEVVTELLVKQINGTKLTNEEQIKLNVYGKTLENIYL